MFQHRHVSLTSIVQQSIHATPHYQPILDEYGNFRVVKDQEHSWTDNQMSSYVIPKCINEGIHDYLKQSSAAD